MSRRDRPRPGAAAGVQWQFAQVFGERAPGEEVQDADLISAVEFDEGGGYLATGDHGGRVVLFECEGIRRGRPTSPPPDARAPARARARDLEFRYMTEFQSHEPEFDYLKSLEIEERINAVRWVRREPASGGLAAPSAHLLLSANDKTIKLWKVWERTHVVLAAYEEPRGSGALRGGARRGRSPSPAGTGGGGRVPHPGQVSSAPGRAGTGPAGVGSAAAPSSSTPSSPSATTTTATSSSTSSSSSASGGSPGSPGRPAAAAPARAVPPPPGGGLSGGSGAGAGGSSHGPGHGPGHGVMACLPPSPPRAASPPPLRLPRVVRRETALAHRCVRTFGAAHAYHINSLSVCADRETALSADDLRVNLWNLDRPGGAWNVLDLKPDAMEDLVEVVTRATFHPTDPGTLAYATSRGAVRLADLRSASALEAPSAGVDLVDPAEAARPKTFFSEIVASVNDVVFSPDGRRAIARDYMTVRIWDLANPSAPLARIPVHDALRPRLGDLYESDSIFDKFDVAVGGGAAARRGGGGGGFGVGAFAGGGTNTGSSEGPQLRAASSGTAPQSALPGYVATGTYCNMLRVAAADQHDPQPSALLEASRDGVRRPSGPRPVSAEEQIAQAEEAIPTDLANKILRLSCHPTHDVIAAAAANSLYLFQGRRDIFQP